VNHQELGVLISRRSDLVEDIQTIALIHYYNSQLTEQFQFSLLREISQVDPLFVTANLYRIFGKIYKVLIVLNLL